MCGEDFPGKSIFIRDFRVGPLVLKVIHNDEYKDPFLGIAFIL